MTLACEIVTLAVPVFVRVMDWVLLLPTKTLPKLMLLGLAVSWGVPVESGGRTACASLEFELSLLFESTDVVT